MLRREEIGMSSRLDLCRGKIYFETQSREICCLHVSSWFINRENKNEFPI
jgi:hypothetical protein